MPSTSPMPPKNLAAVRISDRSTETDANRLPHRLAAAVSLTVNASGVVSLQTVELLTPEQVDEASKKSVDYRLPGA